MDLNVVNNQHAFSHLDSAGRKTSTTRTLHNEKLKSDDIPGIVNHASRLPEG